MAWGKSAETIPSGQAKKFRTGADMFRGESVCNKRVQLSPAAEAMLTRAGK